MPHQVVIGAVSVYDRADESKAPEDRRGEEVVKQGDLLPDYVDPYQIFVLTQTGMVRFVEEADPRLVAEANQPIPVVLPEHVLPAGTMVNDDGAVVPVEPVVEPDDGDDDGPPPASAPKGEWVAYASDERTPDHITVEEAEAKTKADLIRDFG